MCVPSLFSVLNVRYIDLYVMQYSCTENMLLLLHNTVIYFRFRFKYINKFAICKIPYYTCVCVCITYTMICMHHTYYGDTTPSLKEADFNKRWHYSFVHIHVVYS